jgi:hypothetical protein
MGGALESNPACQRCVSSLFDSPDTDTERIAEHLVEQTARSDDLHVLACHGERALEPAELFHEADVPRLAPDPPRPAKSRSLLWGPSSRNCCWTRVPLAERTMSTSRSSSRALRISRRSRTGWRTLASRAQRCRTGYATDQAGVSTSCRSATPSPQLEAWSYKGSKAVRDCRRSSRPFRRLRRGCCRPRLTRARTDLRRR